jgi:hypothetical protein
VVSIIQYSTLHWTFGGHIHQVHVADAHALNLQEYKTQPNLSSGGYEVLDNH